jgi:hypothetical protein
VKISRIKIATFYAAKNAYFLGNLNTNLFRCPASLVNKGSQGIIFLSGDVNAE